MKTEVQTVSSFCARFTFIANPPEHRRTTRGDVTAAACSRFQSKRPLHFPFPLNGVVPLMGMQRARATARLIIMVFITCLCCAESEQRRGVLVPALL